MTGNVLHTIFHKPTLINWVRYVGDVVICGGRGCAVWMWNLRKRCEVVQEGRELGMSSAVEQASLAGAKPFRTFRGKCGEIICLAVDSDYFVTGSADQKVCVYKFGLARQAAS